MKLGLGLYRDYFVDANPSLDSGSADRGWASRATAGQRAFTPVRRSPDRSRRPHSERDGVEQGV
jgi:hypothetical protein